MGKYYLLSWCPMGPFTNYVTHFLLFFDHPPTHSNALAIILLMTYNTRVCYSNAFANHPPTPAALRNMWMTPKMNSIICCIYLNSKWSIMHTLFKIIKSPQWNCHTSIPTLSINMHLSNVKIDHMTKFCRRPRSKGQKQVKNRLKFIKICLFWPDFTLWNRDTDRF